MNIFSKAILVTFVGLIPLVHAKEVNPVAVLETLPALKEGKAPQSFDAMWTGFDPQAEPLDVEVLKE